MTFLLFLFAIIFVPVFSLLIYGKRFINPNKLIFIFGKKGSGKSTYMVKLMLRHLKRGWTIYTNMIDINIPGVRIFNLESLTRCTPDEHSVVFIDEGGITFDNRNYKNFDRGYTEWFKFQRKYKCKVYINSQSFDIDKKLRDLTDSMVLQVNYFNVIGVGKPIIRTVKLTEATADSESRIADQLKFDKPWRWQFTWLPRYFKYFDSYNAPKRQPVPYRVVKAPESEQNVDDGKE